MSVDELCYKLVKHFHHLTMSSAKFQTTCENPLILNCRHRARHHIAIAMWLVLRRWSRAKRYAPILIRGSPSTNTIPCQQVILSSEYNALNLLSYLRNMAF